MSKRKKYRIIEGDPCSPPCIPFDDYPEGIEKLTGAESTSQQKIEYLLDHQTVLGDQYRALKRSNRWLKALTIVALALATSVTVCRRYSPWNEPGYSFINYVGSGALPPQITSAEEAYEAIEHARCQVENLNRKSYDPINESDKHAELLKQYIEQNRSIEGVKAYVEQHPGNPDLAQRCTYLDQFLDSTIQQMYYSKVMAIGTSLPTPPSGDPEKSGYGKIIAQTMTDAIAEAGNDVGFDKNIARSVSGNLHDLVNGVKDSCLMLFHEDRKTLDNAIQKYDQLYVNAR